MNKIGKVMVSVLLIFTFLFAISGCTENEPFVPPEPDGSKVSINDAYDWNDDKSGSNRPDLGGDYEPTLPPKDSTVTISEESSIRFVGGATTKVLDLGSVLKESDFDESTLNGHKVGGVGFLGESGNISGFLSLGEFAPMEDTTVLPYFAPENGDPYIFGSNEVGDWYFDSTGTDLTDIAPLTTEYKLVDGFMGRLISCGGALSENDYFRSVTTRAREQGQIYTYYYRFANFGETEISFTVHQMSGGHDWANPSTNVSSDKITLAPGATTLTAIDVEETRNDSNTLTLIRMNSTVAALRLGVSMETKNITPTEPATITLELPDGFTVAPDYVTSVRTNDKLVLPTVGTNTTGHNFRYWAYADGTRAEAGVRITGDITLKPILTEDVHITFELPGNFSVSDSYARKWQTYDRLALPTAEQITNNTGKKFLHWVNATTGEIVPEGLQLTGDIKLAPQLAAPAVITVSLPTGLSVSADYVRNVFTGDNFVVPTTEQITGTIADGRTIAGWYNVADNSIIDENTTIRETAVTIAPYFTRRSNTATMCNFDDSKDGQPLVFNNNQGTLLPLNVYPTTNSSLALASFTAMASRYTNNTVVGGGVGGYAELGNTLQYNGTMLAGDAFRCAAIVSNNDKNLPVVELGVEHTFYYNFANLGKSAVTFTIQGVNSGKEVEGPIETVSLAPGESTVTSFKVTYTKGSKNKNVIGFFTIQENVTDLKLGVSVNVVFGKHKAAVTLKSGIEGFSLNESYLNQVRYVGDELILPTANDYTDANSEKRDLIGWKDASGNTLTNGMELTGSLELVPVFKNYATVTFNLPEGITFTGGFNATNKCVIGTKLVLPTEQQITNTTGKAILRWMLQGTTTVVNGDTEITADMVIEPYLEPDVQTPVTITAATVDGFTISAEYLAKEQYLAGLLVLPKDGDFTNETGKKLIGWMDQKTNTDLTDGMIISLDEIVLCPILEEYADFIIDLPSDMTLADGYNTKYTIGEELVLPTEEEITADGGRGTPSGWFNVATGETVSNGLVIADGLKIAPYWQNAANYGYMNVGSASNTGYNTDEVPGELVTHLTATEKSATYQGSTKPASGAKIVYGGANGSVLGSWITDTAPVTAGSAIRLDTVHVTELTANTVVEFNYTVWNRGTTALKLSIYQISGSAEYKFANGKQYDYESRYRVEIDLAPGASVNKTAQYLLGANKNALTYIVFEQDVQSFGFGIAMSSKIVTGATDVADTYKNQAAFVNPVTLSYTPAENSEITVNSSYLTQRAGRYIAEPKTSEFTCPDGVSVYKWQLVIGGETYDLAANVDSHTCLRVPSSGATLKAVPVDNRTVTFEANNGVNVEGAKRSYNKGEKLVLPALTTEGITDGRTHVGWFDTATKNILTNDFVVMENMTVAPYFTPAGTALRAASGVQDTDKGLDNFKIGSLTDAEVRANFTKEYDVFVGDEKGMVLSYSGNLATGNTFRFKTSCAIAVKNYKFTYIFENRGAQALSFTVYQVRGSNTIVTDRPAAQSAVTLAAGEVKTVELTLNFTGTNTNALTYFVMSGAVNGFELGIAMSVAEVTA